MPGTLMLLPVSVLSLAVLVINDHFLKQRYHDLLTGKLSDGAGLVFFPLFLASLTEVLLSIVIRKQWCIPKRGLGICILATGAVFGLTKTFTPIGHIYRTLIAVMEWPFFAVESKLRGSVVPGVSGTHLVHDLTDLLVLPLLIVPWWFGRQKLI